jgi:hypothetical protein
MERWREQWEIKLIEFLRCIRSFSTMADTWTALATKQQSKSHQAYAKKSASMYLGLRAEVEAALITCQKKEPTVYKPGESVVQYIIRHRQTELADFHSRYVCVSLLSSFAVCLPLSPSPRLLDMCSTSISSARYVIGSIIGLRSF